MILFNKKAKFLKYQSIILFISIILSTFRPSIVHAFYEFREYLDKGWSRPDTWHILQNDGTITFNDEFLSLTSSHPRKFPYIYSDIIFPTENNVVEIKFRFNVTAQNYNYGAGISISDNLPRPEIFENPGPQHSLVVVWPLPSNRFVVASTVCPENNPSCSDDFFFIYTAEPSKFSEWHKLTVKFIDDRFWVYINGEEKFVSTNTERIPKYFWMGNSIKTATNVIWASFSVDYVYINSISEAPLILLPGLGGSWSTDEIIHNNPVGVWGKVPIGWPYDNLKNTLISPQAGYVEDETYYEFYYDWRKRLDDLADDLDDFINNKVLKDKPADTQVSLLGHSMGGLVARAYANKYGDSKLENIITVGSPHKGALPAYYGWANGETDDKLSLFYILGGLYLALHRSEFHSYKDALHSYIPSIQDLLPTFDYLINEDGVKIDVNSMSYQNNYIKSLLDPQTFKDKLNTIYGMENNPDKDTVEFYQVEDPTPDEILNGLWTDGRPIGKQYTPEGDLTVLKKSAVLSAVLADPEVEGDHKGIVASASGIGKILERLGILGVNPISNPLPFEEPPFLVFHLNSPAELKVVAPDGEIGHKVTDPIARATYSPQDKLIFIPQAQEGVYEIQIMGTDRGIYHFFFGQFTEDKSQWQTIVGKTTNGQTRKLTIDFNPDSLQENSLIDKTGKTTLELAKERLEALDIYLNNISPVSTKKTLKSKLKRIISNINLALKYQQRRDYDRSSRYVFSSISSCLSLRIDIIKLEKKGNPNPEQSIYIRNELAETSQLLKQAWLSIFKQTGRKITPVKAQSYQRAIERLYNRFEGMTSVESSKGENKNLGLAFSLAKGKRGNADDFLDQEQYAEAYINYVFSRLYLLETLQLLK